MGIMGRLKAMLILFSGILTFLGGLFISDLFRKHRERRELKQFIKRKESVFGEKIDSNNKHIDSTPIELLLEDGEYLRERPKKH